MIGYPSSYISPKFWQTIVKGKIPVWQTVVGLSKIRQFTGRRQFLVIVKLYHQNIAIISVWLSVLSLYTDSVNLLLTQAIILNQKSSTYTKERAYDSLSDTYYVVALVKYSLFVWVRFDYDLLTLFTAYTLLVLIIIVKIVTNTKSSL